MINNALRYKLEARAVLSLLAIFRFQNGFVHSASNSSHVTTSKYFVCNHSDLHSLGQRLAPSRRVRDVVDFLIQLFLPDLRKKVAGRSETLNLWDHIQSRWHVIKIYTRKSKFFNFRWLGVHKKCKQRSTGLRNDAIFRNISTEKLPELPSTVLKLLPFHPTIFTI